MVAVVYAHEAYTLQVAATEFDAGRWRQTCEQPVRTSYTDMVRMQGHFVH